MLKNPVTKKLQTAILSGDQGSSATLASTVYDRLRVDILAGELKPGQKLRIEFLGKHYHTGHIPLREALNRLSADGLVEHRDQRGFRVTAVSAADLADITKARCIVECAALHESIKAHTAEWEEGLVIAYHRLSRTPRSISSDRYKANPAWEPLHREFHRALISACGSRWMLNFCMQLADQSYRYRQVAFTHAFPLGNDTDRHRAIMQAAIDGDADKAVQLLRAHLGFTARTVISKNDTLVDTTSDTTSKIKKTVIARSRKKKELVR
jgi:DNA-binding GntR family transcriptional regulator